MKYRIKVFLASVLTVSMLTTCALAQSENAEETRGIDPLEIHELNLSNMKTSKIDGIDVTSVLRAVGSVEFTVRPGTIARVSSPLSLEPGDEVTINCIYTPRNADVDFGLIAEDNIFHFISGDNGSIQKTIEVNKMGNYYFAVRNNSDDTIEVMGYVYY